MMFRSYKYFMPLATPMWIFCLDVFVKSFGSSKSWIFLRTSARDHFEADSIIMVTLLSPWKSCNEQLINLIIVGWLASIMIAVSLSMNFLHCSALSSQFKPIAAYNWPVSISRTQWPESNPYFLMRFCFANLLMSILHWEYGCIHVFVNSEMWNKKIFIGYSKTYSSTKILITILKRYLQLSMTEESVNIIALK